MPSTADGTLKARTRVKVVEEAGSHWRVETEDEVVVDVMRKGTEKDREDAIAEKGITMHPSPAQIRQNILHPAPLVQGASGAPSFPIGLARISQCAVKGLLIPVGAKPTRRLVAPAGSTWSGGRRRRIRPKHSKKRVIR